MHGVNGAAGFLLPDKQQQQAHAQGIVFSTYMAVLPAVVAAHLGDGPTHNTAPSAIVARAWGITVEAVRPFGVNIQQAAPPRNSGG